MITIERGITCILIQCTADGSIINTNVNIQPFVQQFLVEYKYDPKTYRNDIKHRHYYHDAKTNILFLPIFISEELEKFLHKYNIQFNYSDNPAFEQHLINIQKSNEYNDREDQIDSIGYVTEPGMKCLELQTGCFDGETTMVEFKMLNNSIRIMSIQQAFKEFKSIPKGYPFRMRYNHITFVKSVNDKHRIIYHTFNDILYSGYKECVRIKTETKELICTLDQLIETELGGWVEAQYVLHLGIIVQLRETNYTVPDEVISVENIGMRHVYDICCNDPFHHFVANGIVVHNSGKTYIATRAITELQQRALVIAPSFLVNQWQNEINKFTNNSAKICKLQESASINDLVINDFSTDADIFIASINTLQSVFSTYHKLQHFPIWTYIVQKLRIGIKIIDEIHLNFNANLIADILSGFIKHNIYLSATYTRGEYISKKIFNHVYPQSIRYDGGMELKRYINMTEFSYSFGYVKSFLTNSKQGYSQFKYEKYLLRNKKILDQLVHNLLIPCINEYYISKRDPDEKMLFLAGTHNFCHKIEEYINQTFPEYKTLVFIYGVNQEEIKNADIIISTIGSCGTGKDINKLRTLILFQSFSSEPRTYQVPGRLRRLASGNTPEFVYLINTGIESHRSHMKTKRPIYKNLAKNFFIRSL